MTGKVLQERIAAVSNIPFNTINEALNHVDSTMAVTDTYIRKSFDNLNEANRLVVDYIVGLKLA